MSDLEEVHKAAVKAVQARLDREAIEHLDFEPTDVQMCQHFRLFAGKRFFCERLADYRMVCRGCGNSSFTCTRHRNIMWSNSNLQTCVNCHQRALICTGWFFQALAG